MSLSGIQDNLMKTHLVQQTQSRGENVSRALESNQSNFQQEMIRKAEETVARVSAAEKNAINPDQEKGKNKQEQKKQEKREQSGSEQNDSQAVSPPGGQHKINIVV